MTRMIPIIPSMIVNIYAALSRVSSLNYAIASSIGKVPAMILFAVVGNSIVTNPQNLIVIALFFTERFFSSFIYYFASGNDFLLKSLPTKACNKISCGEMARTKALHRVCTKTPHEPRASLFHTCFGLFLFV